MNRKAIISALLITFMLIVPMTAWAVGTIAGTVVTSGTGTPISGLQVSVSDSNWIWYGSATTGALGNYSVSNLPERTDYQVQVQGNATNAGQTQTGIAVTPNATTTVNFALQPGGTISGMVTSGTGTPISGLQVNVCFLNGCPGYAETDPSGNYTIVGMPVRSDLQVQVQGNATYASQTKTNIAVTAGNVTVVNFSLALAGSIAGTVTASGTSAAISGLQVSVSDSNWQWYGAATTNPSGGYTIVGLPARTDYQVQVQGNATYAGQTKNGITVTAESTTAVNFALDLGGNVSGTVRDAVTGLVIGGISVQVYDPVTNNWNMLGYANTNPDGTYQILGIPAGSHRVTASSNNGGWYVRQFYNGVTNQDLATSITVTIGNFTTGINFNMNKGGTISGVVRNGSGSPLANAQVAAILADGSWMSDTRTDGSGTYTLGPVPTGVAVKASAPGTNYVGQYYGAALYLNSATTVTVAPEMNTPGIDITLPAGGVLTGTLTVDSVVPLSGYVGLYSVTDSRWLFNSAVSEANTDPATGVWSVAVPAGTYKVWGSSVNASGVDIPPMYYNGTYIFDSASPVVSTGTGTVSGLNILMSSASGTVTGTVSYSGAQTGLVIEWTSPNPGNDWPKMSSGNGGGVGAYTLHSTAGTWYVKAFMDVNNNMHYDAGEPFGEYAGGAVVVTNGVTVSGVNIVLTANKNILWRNTTTGENAVWNVTGATRTGSAFLDPMYDQNWRIVGTGDFNSDSQPDLVWRNTTSGDNAVWYMNGATRTGSAFLDPLYDQNWQLIGTGDFNSDGKPDLVWRNTTSGDNAVWYMTGATRTGSAFLDALYDLSWKIVGIQ